MPPLPNSLRRRAAWIALPLVLAALVSGCSDEGPGYVGTWERDEEFLRIDRNGLGEARIFGAATARPITWTQSVDKITVTVGSGQNEHVIEGRLEGDATIRLSSPRGSTTLARASADAAASPPARPAPGGAD